MKSIFPTFLQPKAKVTKTGIPSVVSLEKTPEIQPPKPSITPFSETRQAKATESSIAPSPLPNHYEVLKVDSGASAKDIKVVYRKTSAVLELEIRSGGISPERKREINTQMQGLREAKKVLTNLKQRGIYDKTIGIESRQPAAMSRRKFLKLLVGGLAATAVREPVTNILRSLEVPLESEVAQAWESIKKDMNALTSQAVEYTRSRPFPKNHFTLERLGVEPNKFINNRKWEGFIYNPSEFPLRLTCQGRDIPATIHTSYELIHPPTWEEADILTKKLTETRKTFYQDVALGKIPVESDISWPAFLTPYKDSQIMPFQKVAVLFPGAGNEYGEMSHVISPLSRLGFMVVEMKYPVKSLSGDEHWAKSIFDSRDQYTFREYQDALFLLEYLKQEKIVDPKATVGMIGASYGAAQSLLCLLGAKTLGYKPGPSIAYAGMYDLLGDIPDLRWSEGMRMFAKAKMGKQELIKSSPQYLVPYVQTREDKLPPITLLVSDGDTLVNPVNTIRFYKNLAPIKRDVYALFYSGENHNLPVNAGFPFAYDEHATRQWGTGNRGFAVGKLTTDMHENLSRRYGEDNALWIEKHDNMSAQQLLYYAGFMDV